MGGLMIEEISASSQLIKLLKRELPPDRFNIIRLEAGSVVSARNYDHDDLKITNISYCYPSKPPGLLQAISVNILGRVYEKKVKALHKVSFSSDRGKVNIICGENGSGKTTLMYILAGYILADEGSIILEDKQLSQEDLWNISSFIQNMPLFLFSRLKVETYFKIVSKMFEVDWRKTLEKDEHLWNKRHMYVGALSRGEKNRLGILTGFMKPAEIFLCDEVDKNLDREGLEIFKKLIIEKVLEGKIVFVTTPV